MGRKKPQLFQSEHKPQTTEKGCKTTGTPMSTAAQFTIARTWLQPRCPPTDERIRKLWHICTMDYYYSAIKRNTSESLLMRQMSLELVIQSEISQTVKDKYRIEMHTYESKKTVLTILLASQQRRHRHFGHSGGGDSGIK